jgi:glutathione synthase/RimK-type ligase-like ATP-grasp enzyme
MSKVGLLVGRENTFPQPFLDLVNQRGRADGVQAEMAVLGGTGELHATDYAVIVDRISHEVPFYRAYLKSAVLLGTVVINDPFWWEADEKFFECTLARKLGVAVPRTVVLPNKGYIPDIDPQRSLRNLQYPLDWEAIVRYTGLPAILKPNTGGGWKDVHRVDTVDDLIRAYDTTGQKTMILQEFIDWDDYLRCICIAREHILPIRYNPKVSFSERYAADQPVVGWLRDRAVADAQRLCDALGYDMNTVEFAVKGDTLYAIDFLNPAPDFDNFSIKESNFRWVLERMTDLVLRYARGEAEPPWRAAYRWSRYVKDAPLAPLPYPSPRGRGE